MLPAWVSGQMADDHMASLRAGAEAARLRQRAARSGEADRPVRAAVGWWMVGAGLRLAVGSAGPRAARHAPW